MTAQPDSGCGSKAQLCDDLIFELKYISNIDRVEPLGFVVWDSLFLDVFVCWDFLETVDSEGAGGAKCGPSCCHGTWMYEMKLVIILKPSQFQD